MMPSTSQHPRSHLFHLRPEGSLYLLNVCEQEGRTIRFTNCQAVLFPARAKKCVLRNKENENEDTSEREEEKEEKRR